MLAQLKIASENVGLTMHKKAKVMIPENIRITVEWEIIENLEEYVYMGILLRKEKTTQLLNFGTCILPVMTYGMETLTPTIKPINKLRKTQRSIERIMLGISLKDHIGNTEIRKRTRVDVRTNSRVKMGHAVPQDEETWTR